MRREPAISQFIAQALIWHAVWLIFVTVAWLAVLAVFVGGEASRDASYNLFGSMPILIAYGVWPFAQSPHRDGRLDGQTEIIDFEPFAYLGVGSGRDVGSGIDSPLHQSPGRNISCFVGPSLRRLCGNLVRVVALDHRHRSEPLAPRLSLGSNN